ncbi:hypothetical protein N9N67_02450 [Bacteriovoracaceae bacterium]|nr:hypothetical protein [Bacteriovoracaceae bacterium]
MAKILILIFTLSFPILGHTKTVTCKKGKHRCKKAGLPWPIKTNFRGKKISFQQNTDYQKYWQDAPYLQVNKLFGLTDCKTYVSSRKKSAMIGWRNLEKDQIEILAYVHRPDIKNSSKNFYHAPIMITKKNVSNKISISNKSNYYIYQSGMKSYTIFKRACSHSKMKGRQINHWFGGQRTAPANIKISDNNFSKSEYDQESKNKFPKIVRFAGKEICQQSNPLQYFKQHGSEINRQLKNECNRSIQIEFEGCHKNVSYQGSQVKSQNSLASLTYKVSCI